MINKYKQIINDINEIIPKIRITEGCSGFGEKLYLISFFIKYFNCKITLDLGVFTGCSLFPQAKIHNKYTNGIVYGVDPYTQSDMEQFDNQTKEYIELQKKFMEKMNFEELYNHVIEQIKNFGFDNNIKFLRQRSDIAINYFKEQNIIFDLMFIDGNHDIKPALNDVMSYIHILRENGIFIIDDIYWSTLQPAYNYAKSNLQLIYEGIGFAILQKTNIENTELKQMIRKILI
jgi:hypothetical protein